jgi:hypothetical protein
MFESKRGAGVFAYIRVTRNFESSSVAPSFGAKGNGEQVIVSPSLVSTLQATTFTLLLATY